MDLGASSLMEFNLGAGYGREEQVKAKGKAALR